MSNQIQTRPLVDAIKAALTSAWGVAAISIGKPRTPSVPLPYAVLYWDHVQVAFGGKVGTLSNTAQNNQFTIIGRFAFPDDPTQIIELLKVDRANELIAILQASSGFGGVGMFPLVESVVATENDNPNEKSYEVTMVFTVVTQASHH